MNYATMPGGSVVRLHVLIRDKSVICDRSSILRIASKVDIEEDGVLETSRLGYRRATECCDFARIGRQSLHSCRLPNNQKISNSSWCKVVLSVNSAPKGNEERGGFNVNSSRRVANGGRVHWRRREGETKL